tara:strand:+ start:722 stop:979 length:258 start_codon:yes stop_codon:yes gene_type:complete
MNDKEKIKENVIQIASEVFLINQENIKINASKENQSEWDSLAHLKLMIAIESKFSIKFSTDEILEINSLDDVTEIITSKNGLNLT